MPPKEERTQRQHVVPAFYLRYFSTDAKIWVVDFHSDKKPYRTGVTNALVMKDFYTVSTIRSEQDDIIERNFSEIETQAKPVFDGLLKGMVLPEGLARRRLMGFIACLYLRGPRMRQMQLELYESAVNFFERRYFSDEGRFEEFYQEYLRKNPETALTREMAKEINEQTRAEGYISRESYIHDFLKSLPAVEYLFSRMSLKVVWADPSGLARFITSDFPFVIEDKATRRYEMPLNGGLLNKNVRIYTPLTPLVCLVLEHEGPDVICVVPHRHFVPITNSQLALMASRYVISGTQTIHWFKDNHVHTSAELLHSEFYPRKLQEPVVQLDSPYGDNVVARRSWGKLRGDKPPQAKDHNHLG